MKNFIWFVHFWQPLKFVSYTLLVSNRATFNLCQIQNVISVRGSVAWDERLSCTSSIFYLYCKVYYFQVNWPTVLVYRKILLIISVTVLTLSTRLISNYIFHLYSNCKWTQRYTDSLLVEVCSLSVNYFNSWILQVYFIVHSICFIDIIFILYKLVTS